MAETDEDRRDRRQARLIHARGWLSEAQLKAALGSRSADDLASRLERRGLLSGDQADAAREASQASQASQAAHSGSTQGSAEVAAQQALWSAALGSLASPRVLELFSSGTLRRYRPDGRPILGGMGFVIKARDLKRGRAVGIKLLLPDRLDDRARARFDREARSLHALDHPGIVRLRKYGIKAGLPFCIMDWVEGETLEAWLEARRSQDGAPDPARILSIGATLARALQYCHDKGLCHRDLKPANIVLRADGGAPVLVDFGLVRGDPSLGGGLEETLTRTGEVAGTPAFMAPEQVDNSGEFGAVGPSTDIWGLAATLHTALMGSPPFGGGSLAELSVQILTRPPSALRGLPRGTPPALCDWIARGLAKDPVDRPSLAELSAIAADPSRPAPRRALSLGWLVGLTGAAAILAGLGLATLPLSHPPVELLEVSASAGMTRDEAVLVRGRASRGEALIEVGGRPIRTLADGAFEVELPLSEGENTIAVATSREAPRRVLTVVCDRSPPVLSFAAPAAEGETLAIGGALTLTGALRDRFPARVRVTPWSAERNTTAGEPVEQSVEDRRGQFAIAVEDRARIQHLLVQGWDAAGNECAQVVAVETPRARARRGAGPLLTEDEARLMAHLRDAESWRAVPPEQLDDVLRFVAQRLGPGFEALGGREERCRELSHWIARFRHRETGLELALIPGALVTVEVWNPPEMEFVIEYLRDLSSDRASAEMLIGAALTPPYPQLAELVQRSVEANGGPRTLSWEGLTAFFESQPAALPKLKARLAEHLEAYARQTAVTRVERRLRPFLMGRFEVTNAEWQAHLDPQRVAAGALEPGLPVIRKSYDEVEAWLREGDGALRLPTRLEWQHACAGGATTPYFWGKDLDGALTHTWCRASANSLQPARAHEGRGNAFGLVDTLGNAEEWADPDWAWWWSVKPAPAGEQVPLESLRSLGAIMGGSVLWTRGECRRGFFFYKPAAQPWYVSGVRVAATIP